VRDGEIMRSHLSRDWSAKEKEPTAKKETIAE